MATGCGRRVRSRRRMKLHRFIVVAVGALVALGALAFAIPPDEADSFAVASSSLCDTTPGLVLVDSVPEFAAPPTLEPPARSDSPRPPPVA